VTSAHRTMPGHMKETTTTMPAMRAQAVAGLTGISRRYRKPTVVVSHDAGNR
jgi:hypothetical protein